MINIVYSSQCNVVAEYKNISFHTMKHDDLKTMKFIIKLNMYQNNSKIFPCNT